MGPNSFRSFVKRTPGLSWDQVETILGSGPTCLRASCGFKILAVYSPQSLVAPRCARQGPAVSVTSTPYIFFLCARFSLFWSFDSKAQLCRSVRSPFFCLLLICLGAGKARNCLETLSLLFLVFSG